MCRGLLVVDQNLGIDVMADLRGILSRSFDLDVERQTLHVLLLKAIS